jgi:hypothetical protein
MVIGRAYAESVHLLTQPTAALIARIPANKGNLMSWASKSRVGESCHD